MTNCTRREGFFRGKKGEMFWERLKEYICPILTSCIAAYGSIVQISDLFIITDDGKTLVKDGAVGALVIYLLFAIFAVGVFVVNIGYLYRSYKSEKNRVFRDTDKEGIDDYLSNFIRSGESIAILTRDMSWISNKNRKMLQDKAKKHDLLIFLPHETPEVTQLATMGADVRYYGDTLNKDPANPLIKSRLTIVDWNKHFPKLTYPVRKDGLHINNEMGSGEPANMLAIDLLQLLLYVSDKHEGSDGGGGDGGDTKQSDDGNKTEGVCENTAKEAESVTEPETGSSSDMQSENETEEKTAEDDEKNTISVGAGNVPEDNDESPIDEDKEEKE